jgi:heme/copper-type cytochrome/quinol oxidase subunit 3
MQGKPIATLRSASGTPTGRLAVWWLIASEVVIFGGLLASYIMHRIGHPGLGVQGRVHGRADRRLQHDGAAHLQPLRVTAHHYAEKGEGVKAANWLMATVAGGVIFAGIKFGIEWPTTSAKATR